MGEQQINFYIWNRKLKEYQLWGSLPIDYISLQTVLVSSFKQLPSFHLVLFYSPIDSAPYIKMIPFSCSNYQCSFEAELVVAEINKGIDASPPSLLGIMGNIGLLFHVSGLAQVLQFEMNETLSYTVTPLGQLIDNGTSVTSIKHSYNGDFDGDCLTDLIILKPNPSNAVSSILQFIRGSETNQYQFIE